MRASGWEATSITRCNNEAVGELVEHCELDGRDEGPRLVPEGFNNSDIVDQERL